MPKTKRGKVVKNISGWRGTCPVCGRTRVKLLWTAQKDGSEVKSCKACAK